MECPDGMGCPNCCENEVNALLPVQEDDFIVSFELPQGLIYCSTCRKTYELRGDHSVVMLPN
jgi:hypothetical protein